MKRYVRVECIGSNAGDRDPANIVSATTSILFVMLLEHALFCTDGALWRLSEQVDCWRERVSNVTELNQIIQHYPLLLSYSLDTSVSRLDFFIQVCTSCYVACSWFSSLVFLVSSCDVLQQPLPDVLRCTVKTSSAF